MIDVRAATSDDVKVVTRIAAEGFYADPVMNWVLPDDSTRLRQLTLAFGAMAREMLSERGVVFLADGSSVALWRDPSFDHAAPRVDEDDPVVGDIPADLVPFRDDELMRFAILDQVMRAGHPHTPHWYLNMVSTLPSHQSRGLGAAVLQPVLERADAEGMPCYLESTNPRNRTLYYRQGFEDMAELHLDGGPSMLQMWRLPQS